MVSAALKIVLLAKMGPKMVILVHFSIYTIFKGHFFGKIYHYISKNAPITPESRVDLYQQLKKMPLEVTFWRYGGLK